MGRMINPDGKARAVSELDRATCPIDCLRDFHHHQRECCTLMEALAKDQVPDRAAALELLDNHRLDLQLHYADEDDGLFPLLLRRAHPEDEIPSLLERLSADHRLAEQMFPIVLAALDRIVRSEPSTPEDREALATNPRLLRSHMILENAVILPLAQKRLTSKDKIILLAGMRARRGGAMAPLRPVRTTQVHRKDTP
jgi:iron-sulfur cluster repair protein YtfE (RIC family)